MFGAILGGIASGLLNRRSGRQQQEAAGRMSEADRQFAREQYAQQLRDMRPNQSNAWGATREWVKNPDGSWSQQDRFSPEQQRRANMFNDIAQRRMEAAGQGIKPDYERMGLGHLLQGGTTGKRPWADSASSSMGGNALRNVDQPVGPNNGWGPLPGGQAQAGGPPIASQPPAPPTGPSAGGGALAGMGEALGGQPSAPPPGGQPPAPPAGGPPGFSNIFGPSQSGAPASAVPSAPPTPTPAPAAPTAPEGAGSAGGSMLNQEQFAEMMRQYQEAQDRQRYGDAMSSGG